jgi:hypothetical protein
LFPRGRLVTSGDELLVLTEAGVLADIDRFFALSLADLGAGPEVVLSAAAVRTLAKNKVVERSSR